MFVWSIIILVVMLMVFLQDLGATMATERDSTTVKWSHATNSRKQLLDAVSSDTVDFIEADILVGRTVSGLENVPIMAHPPEDSSDISFAEWIEIATREPRKGLKLDFKDINAVEPCLEILRKVVPHSEAEIWLNADILDGPGSPETPALDRVRFLNLTRSCPVKHRLSIGWTTGAEAGPYTWRNVFDMLAVIEDIPPSTPITFPVRLSKLSFHPLALLLCLQRKTSLTLWSKADDHVLYDEAVLLQRTFHDKIFLDLPTAQRAELERKLKLSEAVTPVQITVVLSSMKNQAYPYSVLTENDGVIILKSDLPSHIHWYCVDGEVEVQLDAEATSQEKKLLLTGRGRTVFYATPRSTHRASVE